MSNNQVRVLNDLELSGSLNFAQNLTGFPENPKPRTLVVKAGVPYLYTEVIDGSGFFSWVPIGNRQTSHVHTQGVASTTWTVTHNFNTVNFGYFVSDADHRLVLAGISSVDANSFQVRLSEAITGTVVVFSSESVFTSVLEATTSLTIGTITLRDANGLLTINNNPVAMQAALAAETAARMAADTALSARIDNLLSNMDPAALDSLAEIVEAFNSNQGNVAAAVQALGTEASSALAAEVNRAVTAELQIANDLAMETAARIAADTALAADIAASAYVLPTATTTELGGVKIDGTTIVIANGAISAVAPMNITGNAGTATRLQTARTINDVAFDGTANITVAAAAGTLTGSTLSANVTASSLTSVGILSGLTVTAPINGSVTGNAGTATKLQTARLINGVAFNGTTDIEVGVDGGSY